MLDAALPARGGARAALVRAALTPTSLAVLDDHPPHASTLSKLASVAEEQWGFVTRRQAERAGVSPAALKRLIRQIALDRTAPAVYRLAGAPVPDHASLRSAWLQLAPETPVWQRRPDDGIVSHRSAAAVYGIGHLPADVHEFTLPTRRQVRRTDVGCREDEA